VWHSLLVLARRAGARTDVGKSVSSAHCPTCGAPESNGASGTCDFCGATLNDASKSWALAEAIASNSPRADELRALIRDTGTPAEEPARGLAASAAGGNGAPAPLMTLSWMVKMSMADGHVDHLERALLEKYAARYGISAERLDGLLIAAQNDTLDIEVPADRNQASATLAALARVALADGKIEASEAEMLRAAGQNLGLSEHDVGQLLKRTRAQMYAEAKEELRLARQSRGNGTGNGSASSR